MARVVHVVDSSYKSPGSQPSLSLTLSLKTELECNGARVRAAQSVLEEDGIIGSQLAPWNDRWLRAGISTAVECRDSWKMSRFCGSAALQLNPSLSLITRHPTSQLCGVCPHLDRASGVVLRPHLYARQIATKHFYILRGAARFLTASQRVSRADLYHSRPGLSSKARNGRGRSIDRTPAVVGGISRPQGQDTGNRG